MNAESSQQAQERDRNRLARNRTGGPIARRINASKILALKGDPAPFNDFSSWAQDCANGKVYFYGGTLPGLASDGKYTADLFSLDLVSMEWQDLTDMLHFTNPYDPFSKLLQGEKLPALQHAACAFISLNDRNFLMVFGGYDQAKSKRSSSLIAIDVDRHSWWWVRPEGIPVISRFSPTMVAIKNRLYIFGGLQDDVILKSYSIIEYADGAWRWVERDRHACYPDGSELPLWPFALSASAVSLYNGKQILLTPGRANIGQTIHFSKENVLFFHSENRTFHNIALTVGDFPQNIWWYQIHVVNHSKVSGRLFAATSGKKRKRDSDAPQISSSTTPRVIICGWTPYPNTDDLIPEFWEYLPFPEDKIMCLNVSQKIWDMDQDLQGIASTKGRLFLLGRDKPEVNLWDIYVEATDLIK